MRNNTKPSNLISTTLDEVKNLTKVKRFLENIEENSKNTGSVYLTGLAQFQDFLKLSSNFNGHSLDSIIEPLSRKRSPMDVYEMLGKFISFLKHKHENYQQVKELSRNSIRIYMTGVRSFLSYYDIDINSAKFERKVKIPKIYREDERPLEVEDVRKILLACSHRRLKAYLLMLASGGMRATEALTVRLKDIDFDKSPTKIHLRKEYTKTHVARDVYISDEATKYLKDWIDFKYRDRAKESGDRRLKNRTKNPEDLIFSVYDKSAAAAATNATTSSVNVSNGAIGGNKFNPSNLYAKVVKEFEKLLAVAGLDQRKEGMMRHTITFHSFRRFVKTVLSKQVGSDYSELFLGHSKSPYYTPTEQEKRKTYSDKCMKYLTFLDYTALEATGANIEDKLSEKDIEIQMLKQRDSAKDQELQAMKSQLNDVVSRVEQVQEVAEDRITHLQSLIDELTLHPPKIRREDETNDDYMKRIGYSDAEIQKMNTDAEERRSEAAAQPRKSSLQVHTEGRINAEKERALLRKFRELSKPRE
jgi:integrase